MSVDDHLGAVSELENAEKGIEAHSAFFKKALGVKRFRISSDPHRLRGFGIGTSAKLGSAHLTLVSAGCTRNSTVARSRVASTVASQTRTDRPFQGESSPNTRRSTQPLALSVIRRPISSIAVRRNLIDATALRS